MEATLAFGGISTTGGMTDDKNQYAILLRRVGKRPAGTVLKGCIKPAAGNGGHGRAFSVDVSELFPGETVRYYYESIFEWFRAHSRSPEDRIWRELSPLEVLAAQGE